MNTQAQISAYITDLPPSKAADLRTLDTMIKGLQPKCRLWFLDGRNAEGKIVSNPNIGYGEQILGTVAEPDREFYQIGLSATNTGISIYILGLKDKTFLEKEYGRSLGKAVVTGYCIKFKKLSGVNTDVLLEVFKCGFAGEAKN